MKEMKHERIWAWDDLHDPGWQATQPTAFDDVTQYVHIDEYNRVVAALDQAIACFDLSIPGTNGDTVSSEVEYLGYALSSWVSHRACAESDCPDLAAYLRDKEEQNA